MKIVAYEVSRMTVLFPFEEVSPIGGATNDLIVHNVAERYQFAKLPDLNVSRAELDKTGLRFERGVLKTASSKVNINEFIVFSDGVVLGAQTTEDAEFFWSDISTWLRAEQGFREFTTPPALRFLSQLVVEFEIHLATFIKHFEKISSSVSKILSTIYNTDIHMDFSRIDLEFDKVGNKSSLVVPKFMIERRVQIPFERERYMCSAPMRTRDHVSVLEGIEQLMA
jgi:hypothetical protein